MRFFFYGTLMDRDILRLVLGLVVPEESLRPAVLDGYRRYRVRGRGYPMLVPVRGGRVAGLIAEGLDETAAARLIWYESDDFAMRRARPRFPGGGSAVAWVFVPRPGGRMQIGGAWRLAGWRRSKKSRVLADLKREIGRAGPGRAALADAHARLRTGGQIRVIENGACG